MKITHTAVFGIFHTEVQAERSVVDLEASGFTKDNISVLLPVGHGTGEVAVEKQTKAPEGATVGVSAGGAIGSTLGLLLGIGALAIPGIGPIVAAGPLLAALAGLGAGGAVGGLVGALVGMGMPEYEAKRYEGQLREGGVLLSVHCATSEEVTRAEELLKQTGAQGISSAGEVVSANKKEVVVTAAH